MKICTKPKKIQYDECAKCTRINSIFFKDTLIVIYCCFEFLAKICNFGGLE